MTTAFCADVLNALAGGRVFDDRMIRQRVEDGELACLNPMRRPRERIKIGPKDFLAYVETYHPQLVTGVKQRLNLAA